MFLYLSLVLCSSEPIEVNESFIFFDNNVETGFRLKYVSHRKNTAYICVSCLNVRFHLYESKEYDFAGTRRQLIDLKEPLFVKHFSALNIIALHPTHIKLIVFTVPDECVDRMWVSNENNASVTFSDSNQPPFNIQKGSTCMLFTYESAMTYNLHINIDEAADNFTSHNNVVQSFQNGKYTVSKDFHYFKLKSNSNSNSKMNRQLSISTASAAPDEATYPFSDFIKYHQPKPMQIPFKSLLNFFVFLGAGFIIAYLAIFRLFKMQMRMNSGHKVQKMGNPFLL